MNGRRKINYQNRELDRLRGENKELQSEVKVLEKEIESGKRTVAGWEERYKELSRQFEEVNASRIADAKALSDARASYQDAARSAREIENKYKELIVQLGIDIKQIKKGGE